MAPSTDNTTTAKASNKRRAPMSCDRCKSRKTKCVDPVPGPCQFCASISAVCHLDPSRRRQRPYYHVSEEEFRYMTKALEHFLPNVDLNLQTLREVVQSFESAPPRGVVADHASSYNMTTHPITAPPSESSSADSIVVSDADNNNNRRTTPASSLSSAGGSSTIKSEEAAVTIEEIDELHGELGWLRVDSKGTYRHVGADSGYGFHAAVRSLRQRRGSDVPSKTDIVPPFTLAPPLPPSTPDSAVTAGGVPSPHHLHHQSLYNGVGGGGGGRRMQIFLPRRDLCNRCVSRFFRDIQSVFWFWSAERFYAVLDRLYAGDPASATPAMLCSLYSILALTCESEAQQATLALGMGRDLTGVNTGDPSAGGSPPPAARYLALAKTLVPALCDEADTDSVRALCLLGLALQSSMFSNTAYIYIGAAARIALTLGLHLQRAIEPKGCLQRQIDLRLYSTLFLLDLDIALCYGNPPAISDEHATGKPQDLSEQILSPGSHMPLDYLTVSCELAQIRRHLSKLLYVRATTATPATNTNTAATSTASGAPATATDTITASSSSSPPPISSPSCLSTSTSTTPKPSIAAVSDVLATLRAWYGAIPPHLRDVSRAASFHQRSVSVLHLRYWSATIFATRPFLLYSALHAEAYATLPAAKRAFFEEFCTMCLDAAKQSLAVIGLMQESGLLSSLITLDTACVLEILQVFLLALARSNGGAGGTSGVGAAPAQDNVRACLRTLQGMEQIFWTSHALVEVMAQLDENGLLNDDNNFSPQGDTPGNFFLDINQQQQQQHIISGVMEAYFSDLHDPFFAMHDDGTSSMLGDHFQDGMHGGLAI